MGDQAKRPDEVVLPLTTEDVKTHGEVVRELRLRTRVQAKDLRAVRDLDSPFGLVLDLAAELADVPPSTVDQLNAADAIALAERVGGFLEDAGFRGIGGISSATSPGASDSAPPKSGT